MATAVTESRKRVLPQEKPETQCTGKRKSIPHKDSIATHPDAHAKQETKKTRIHHQTLAAAAAAAQLTSSADEPSVTLEKRKTHAFDLRALEDFKKETATISTIRRIVSIIHGSTNLISLTANFRTLKDMGRELEGIKPLCFLWALLADEDSSRFLKEMLFSSKQQGFFHKMMNTANILKWRGFLGVSEEHDKGVVRELEKVYGSLHHDEYLGDFEIFCAVLHLDFNKLKENIRSKNWGDLVERLLDQDIVLSTA